MKALKTKWLKDEQEIDAYIHVTDFVVTKGRLPSGQGGMSPTPVDYGSMILYKVTEDEAGEIFLSHGQSTQVFDIDDIKSVKDSIKNTLKNLAHFKDVVEIPLKTPE
jgi:hypothetical protein